MSRPQDLSEHSVTDSVHGVRVRDGVVWVATTARGLLLWIPIECGGKAGPLIGLDGTESVVLTNADGLQNPA
jgi:hypothetical protein